MTVIGMHKLLTDLLDRGYGTEEIMIAPRDSDPSVSRPVTDVVAGDVCHIFTE